MVYITKDKNGNIFKWSRKGKHRECWVKNKNCVVKECFVPEDCGTVDPKTQQKNILGMCRVYFDGKCSMGYHYKDNCPIKINNIAVQQKYEKRVERKGEQQTKKR